jgi:hypothetical protein
VFASFDPGDIDASRSLQEGPRVLKRFLEFAKHGRIDDSAPTGETADSPFEEDVADVIRGLGFLADPQVGAAGFRIDLGVRHPDKPGTYLLAVECDGATYHSALWARERDRLRQGVRIEGANKGRPPVVETKPVEAEVIEAPEVVQRKMPAYRRYEGRVRASHEPHEAPLSMLDELVRVIVEAEGPVHLDEIARRVAVSFGKEKAGARIVASTRTALASLRSRDAFILCDADFWFNEAQAKSLPVRDRSAETGATLKAASISLLEIREALRIAREDNAGGDDEDLIRSAARLLGFKRVGPDLRDRILQGL